MGLGDLEADCLPKAQAEAGAGHGAGPEAWPGPGPGAGAGAGAAHGTVPGWEAEPELGAQAWSWEGSSKEAVVPLPQPQA